PYWTEEVKGLSLSKINVTLVGKQSLDLSIFSPCEREKFEARVGPWPRGPWPRGIIPYKFDCALKSIQKARIKNVLRTIEAFTCLKFVTYTIKKGRTTNQRRCLRHHRYVLFSEITKEVDRVKYRKRRLVHPDLETSHSRYYQMKTLSNFNRCYDRCNHFKIKCENDGYLTLVYGRCACVCPSGLDPSTGCRSVFTSAMTKKDLYPSGPYALPLVNSSADCPSQEFDKKRIQFYIDSPSRNGPKSNQTYVLFYCVHTRKGWPWIQWPLGSYCIFLTTSRCPRKGFQWSHTIYLRKSDRYAGDTGLQFIFLCCKRSGFAEEEMVLPFKLPFTLIKNWKSRCRPAKGMYLEHSKPIPYRVEVETETEVEVKKNSHYTLEYLGGEKINLCSYRPALTDCGGVFRLNKTSSSYSFYFSNDREIVQCTWLFKATETEYSRLVLDIENVAIEHVSDWRKCTQYSRRVNELEVRYQRVGEPGISVCGTSFPKSIISERNTLLLRLITVGRQWANFTATVRAIEPEDMCYSMKDSGRTYVGDVNFTRDFEPCLPWSETTECQIHIFNPKVFNTVLDGNKCRNPNPDVKIRPWCYTDKKDCKWNYCDVCLIGRIYDTRLDCYKTGSAVDCPIYGCAKTCSHVLPKVDAAPTVGRIRCDRPTDTFVGAEPILPTIPRDTFDVGESLFYKCQNKKKLLTKRFCLTNGQWSSLGGSVCLYNDTYCADMWPRCAELIKKYPSFCRIFRFTGMPYGMCAFTCGKCRKTQTPRCVVKRGGRLAVLRRKQGLAAGDRVHRGTSVSYRCRLTRWARYLPDSGNKVRACLASGRWSGSRLTCRNVCLRSWKYNQENRMCYKKIYKRQSYIKALGMCLTLGGELVSLKSQDELRFIQDLKDGAQIWIGLDRLLSVTNTTENSATFSDSGENDDPGWFWRSDGSRPLFANWRSGHPFSKSTNKHCVVMGYSGWWKSLQCLRAFRFVCQTPARWSKKFS
ncbi:hypothetical protein RRG08_008125, partial [Elysia crispata]